MNELTGKSAANGAVALLCMMVVVFALRGPALGATATWNVDGGGIWSDPNNWDSSPTPNGVDDTANLTKNITTAATISLDTDVTLGTLNLGDPDATHALTVNSAGGRLIFDATSGNAQLNKLVTNSTLAYDTISAPLVLNANLDITIAATNLNTGGIWLTGGIAESAGGLRLTAVTRGGFFEVRGKNQQYLYSGDTIINRGTFKVGGDTADTGIPNGVGKGNMFVYDGGQFALQDNETINGLNGTAASAVQITARDATLTVGDNDASGSFDGVMKEYLKVLSLTKIGNGVQSLGGANIYRGPTTVNGGTLRIVNSSGSGTGTGTLAKVTINASGTLDGTGFIQGSVTNNGTISAGLGSPSVGKLTTGALRLNSTSTAAFDCIVPGNNDQIEITGGALTVEAGAKVKILGNAAPGVYRLIKCNAPGLLPAVEATDLAGKWVELKHDGTWLTANVVGEGACIVIR